MSNHSIEITEQGWLHIRLDCLIPVCRYGSISDFRDELCDLIDRYIDDGKPMPFFKQAFMAIDEHSDEQSRHPYDSDNKGWKVFSNVLKGLVFEDDDTLTLSIGLYGKRSETNCCHVYVMDIKDCARFHEWRWNALQVA